MTSKEKSTVQEQLATLYLRLNGYLTTGFIIHSDQKKIEGELDIVAVRFPLHKQEDTEHNSSDFLEIPSNIDIIIAEVKSFGQVLQFNDCLKQQETQDPWYKLLLWIGVFKEEHVYDAALQLSQLVQSAQNSHIKNIRSTKGIESPFGTITVRPILFSPERINANNTDKFVNWTELNDFIWKCLCPDTIRERSGTRYDFTAWGQGLSEIVKVYKDRQKGQSKIASIDDLYNDIERIRNTKK